MARLIYDLGANNGDNLPYYLQKADKVVAVEANPLLADQIRSRFADAIASGRLVVENCAVTDEPSADAAPFYIHRTKHVLSQFPKPAPEKAADYEEIAVAARNVVELIRAHGDPHYVKVDVPLYEYVILAALFAENIKPPYVSGEAHTMDAFAVMVATGGYKAFKLMDGGSVERRYRNHPIKTPDGERLHSFPLHSAGPFGEDIAGPWIPKDKFFSLLAFERLGWKDVHASRFDEPDASYEPPARVIAWLKNDARTRAKAARAAFARQR